MNLNEIDLNSLNTAGKAMVMMSSKGFSAVEALEKATQNPMKTNEELLLKVLDDNKDTEYGKKYDFANIKSIKEFQEKVPVTSYDDYIDYIIRMTEDGEEGLLTNYPVHHYNKSSGTMGNPKRVPMSDQAIEVFLNYTQNAPVAHIIREFGLGPWMLNKTLSLTESEQEIPTLKNGATYSAVTSKTLTENKAFVSELYVSPEEGLFPPKDTNTRYIHARFGLADKNLMGSTASFFSYYLELMRYIENNWKMLVDDIEKGTISVPMNDEVKDSLLKQIEPMPERAAELRAIFEEGFDEPFVPRVWPNMKFLFGIGTGGFKTYADILRERYLGEDIKQLKLGLSASEGLFSAPYAFDKEDTVLVPNSVFFEFLPLDAGDDFSKIVTIDEVEPGKDYELIITNLSGFYRYRMRDAVRVVGKYNNTPTIEFLYRIDQSLSIMGEKTTEMALRKAVYDMADELGIELIDFSVYGDIDSTPMRYIYFLELGEVPKDVKPKEMRYVLEQKLAEANPSMGDKVRKGLCGYTKINFLEPKTYLLYRDVMIAKGTAPGQLKPVRIINNEIQRSFFFGTTEYGYTHVDI